MDDSPRPPAYAWNWFARQRLLWREARSRLAAGPHATAPRYRAAETKGDVLTLLRADYPRDDRVRAIVAHVVAELAFLGRTNVSFSELGVSSPPRGMRWWWTAITGEQVDVARPDPAPSGQLSLALDDVHEGLGG